MITFFLFACFVTLVIFKREEIESAVRKEKENEYGKDDRRIKISRKKDPNIMGIK